MLRTIATTIGITVCLAVASPASAQGVCPGPAPSTTAAEQQFLSLTNAERAAAGVPAYRWNETTAAMWARTHAQAMASAGTIWHQTTFFDEAPSVVGATYMGENVGMGCTVEAIHVALMNSPGHRANLLHKSMNTTGMGVVIGADGMIFISQQFAYLAPANEAPAIQLVSQPAQPAAPKPAKATTKAAVANKPAPTQPPATPEPVPTVAPSVTVTGPTVAATPDPTPVAADPVSENSEAGALPGPVGFASALAAAAGGLVIRRVQMF